MSIVIEAAKAAWDHKEQIFDGVVILVSGRYVWRALRRVGTIDIPPESVAIARGMFDGHIRVMSDRTGQPLTGMGIRHPFENRRFMYTGPQRVKISDRNDSEDAADVMLVLDGKPSPGWKFDTELIYQVNRDCADELVRTFGGDVSDKVEKILIEFADLARANTLNGMDVRKMSRPDVFAELSERATENLRGALSKGTAWSHAVKVYMFVKDAQEPPAVRDFMNRELQIQIRDKEAAAALQRDRLALKGLGRDAALQLVNVREGGGRIITILNSNQNVPRQNARIIRGEVTSDGRRIVRSVGIGHRPELINHITQAMTLGPALLEDPTDSQSSLE